MAAFDLEILFENNERNRWGGGYFEINEPRASTSTENYQQESTENVSSTEQSETARLTACFPIVDVKDYDIAEKTFHYIQVNHMIEKPKIVSAETEENFMRAKLIFMLDIKTLIQKTSVDPLKNCLRNNERERAPEEFSPVFTEHIGLLFVGEKIVKPEELKKKW